MIPGNEPGYDSGVDYPEPPANMDCPEPEYFVDEEGNCNCCNNERVLRDNDPEHGGFEIPCPVCRPKEVK